MNANAKVLKLLLAGEYICPVRYDEAFRVLEDESEQEAVGDWLRSLGMRLARLGDEGAFFMAHDFLGPKEITQVKNELLSFRDEYGPAVLLLDFMRQTDASRVHLSQGEFISVFQLESAVAQSSMLETQLKSLVSVISKAAMRNSNHENLRLLLEHLAKDGYMWLANKETSTYQVTGKIEQLYAVLQFLDENKVVPDAEVDDLEEVQDDLVDQASAAEESRP